MDRNSFIGLILIGAILVIYSIYSAPSEEELKLARIEQEAKARVTEEAEESTTATQPGNEKMESATDSVIETHPVLSDSIKIVQQNDLYGEFSKSAIGEEKYIKVETDDLILTFSNLGGRIVSAELKNYRKYDQSPLILFDPQHSVFNLNFFTNENKNIYTDEVYFTTSENDKSITGDNEYELTYTLKSNDGNKSLSFVYVIPGSGFMTDVDIKMINMDQVVDRRSAEIGVTWNMETPSLEKSLESQRNASTIYYKYLDEDPDYISETSDDKEELLASIQWIAFKQQYFATALIADQAFDKFNAEIETETNEESERVKQMRASFSIPFAHTSDEVFGYRYFFGPNHFQTLEGYDIGLESLIPLGWGIFGWVNEWLVIPIFNFLDGFNLNYGIIILLMTIIIKMLLSPITWKTYVSSAKMKVLKPEIQEISDKHKDDPMKKQQATMQLYKKAGVNPLAGCVPMLIQLPILFAMFRFFPASIELRQQSFLWADDLSSYDSILDLPFEIPFYGAHVSLFTLLMAVSMVFYTRVNSAQMGMGGAGGGGASDMMATQMKIMMYVMPFMMLFFFNSYSSGLSYYYFIANVISMAQMYAIKKWFIDEDKIHKQIQINKAKPMSQKKSRFQKKLEDMAKQKGQQPRKK